MKYCSGEDPTRCSPSFPPSLYTTHKFPGDPEKDFLLLITFRFTFKYLQHISIVAQPEVINAIITTNAAVVHPSRLFKVLTSSIPRLGIRPDHTAGLKFMALLGHTHCHCCIYNYVHIIMCLMDDGD